MSNIKERLDSLKNKIQTSSFLEGKGLSNEVSIWMFCYEAEDEMTVRHFVDQLGTDQGLKCNLCIRNLYDLFLSACEESGILEAIPDMEESDGGVFLLEQLHSAIGTDEFISRMGCESLKQGDVLVLTGVGECFPFMRIHKLLEAIQPHNNDTPILVMYPGDFNGRQTKLFNRLKANDYYRAFNVL